jgi:hypothetical protein
VIGKTHGNIDERRDFWSAFLTTTTDGVIAVLLSTNVCQAAKGYLQPLSLSSHISISDRSRSRTRIGVDAALALEIVMVDDISVSLNGIFALRFKPPVMSCEL